MEKTFTSKYDVNSAVAFYLDDIELPQTTKSYLLEIGALEEYELSGQYEKIFYGTIKKVNYLYKEKEFIYFVNIDETDVVLILSESELKRW